MKAAVNLLKKPAKTGNVELAMETALKLLKVCILMHFRFNFGLGNILSMEICVYG